MSEMDCPNVSKCPIFSGVLKGTEYTHVYKSLYCQAGTEDYSKCKRYQIASKVGKCPSNVLPNSTKSVEEIITEMKATGEIG